MPEDDESSEHQPSVQALVTETIGSSGAPPSIAAEDGKNEDDGLNLPSPPNDFPESNPMGKFSGPIAEGANGPTPSSSQTATPLLAGNHSQTSSSSTATSLSPPPSPPTSMISPPAPTAAAPAAQPEQFGEVLYRNIHVKDGDTGVSYRALFSKFLSGTCYVGWRGVFGFVSL